MEACAAFAANWWTNKLEEQVLIAPHVFLGDGWVYKFRLTSTEKARDLLQPKISAFKQRVYDYVLDKLQDTDVERAYLHTDYAPWYILNEIVAEVGLYPPNRDKSWWSGLPQKTEMTIGRRSRALEKTWIVDLEYTERGVTHGPTCLFERPVDDTSDTDE